MGVPYQVRKLRGPLNLSRGAHDRHPGQYDDLGAQVDVEIQLVDAVGKMADASHDAPKLHDCRSEILWQSLGSGLARTDILVIDERIQNEAQRAAFIGQGGMDLEQGRRRSGRCLRTWTWLAPE